MATTKPAPTHADLIRALVAHAPPLPEEQCEQIRRLVKRAANDGRPVPEPRPVPTGPQGPNAPTPPPPPN